MIRKMINDRSSNDIYQKTQHSRIAVNKNKYCNIYNDIEPDQNIGNTIIFSSLVKYFIYNDIGKNFRTIYTTAISQNQWKPDSKNRTAKSHRKKMFRIQFKRNFFKISKTNRIDNKSNEYSDKELFSQKEDSGDQKRKENKKNT